MTVYQKAYFNMILHKPATACSYPVNPQKESAKSRLAAEKGWLALGRELGVIVNVFRLGGIYGPGRRFVLYGLAWGFIHLVGVSSIFYSQL